MTSQISDMRDEKVGSQQGFSNFQNIVKDLESKLLGTQGQVLDLQSQKSGLES